MASTIASRWRKRRAIRIGLLENARDRLRARKTKTNLATVKLRRRQVAAAERVIARHPDATLAERTLHQAELMLARHIFETGGNNRGPWVERIIRYAKGDIGEPWCVDFVIWCAGHAGSKQIRPGYPRAVAAMWTAGVVATQDPVPGDAVRFKFDHTGIFVKDNGDGTIQTIEGNTGARGAVSDGNGNDGVYRKRRSKSDVRDYIHATA